MSLDRIDHLVYAAPELQHGIDVIAVLTGVVAAPGGQHPGRGTRNALLSLGPRRYLEIIAPDPGQPAPAQPRWLGVDVVRTPRLTAWAAHGTDLPALVARAAAASVPLGAVRSGARTRADGATLAWQLTEPDPVLLGGCVPFLIDWGASPHPSETAAGGATLLELRVEHPEVGQVSMLLRALDLDVLVDRAESPALVATLQTPRGVVVLR